MALPDAPVVPPTAKTLYPDRKHGDDRIGERDQNELGRKLQQ